MNDNEIVALFYERSEQAITALSAQYGKLCRQIAGNILGNEEDAKECVNDALLGVWNAIPPARPASLIHFVCRITRNVAIKAYRRNTAAKRNSAYDVCLDELAECLPDSGGVESAYDAKEVAAEIGRFLRTCQSRDRVAFVRRYYFCDSLPAIAERLGMDEHAVSVRLYRTKNALRKHLLQKGVSV